MCNLYSIKTSASEIKMRLKPTFDFTNGASFDEKIYPDYPAPVVRNNLDGTELAICRWGMPTPPVYVKGDVDKGITNVRNTSSRHWKRWLTVANRCLVPATSFSEYGQEPHPETGKKPLHWFAIDESKPLFFFAGIWTEWIGIRKPSEGQQNHTLFGLLTSEPNEIVSPIHPKAMPVILTEPEDLDMWMTAPWEIAKELQRPLSDKKLIMVE